MYLGLYLYFSGSPLRINPGGRRPFNGVALAISQSQGRLGRGRGRGRRPPVRSVCHSCDSYLASIVTSLLARSLARPSAAPPLAEMTFA